MEKCSNKTPLSSTSFPSSTSPTAPAPPLRGGQATDQRPTYPGPEQSERSLPCLNSNNCTKALWYNDTNPLHILRPHDLRKAYAIKENAEKFIAVTGINQVGFLTLTYPDQVRDHKIAARRWHSMRTHFFDIFGHWHLVKERTKDGKVHLHLLVDMRQDIRTGFDFDLYQESVKLRKAGKPYRHIERRAFKTANSALRNLWATLRQICPNYGFGRHELLPIRTTAEAAAKYVGKYVSKHVHQRWDEDKGVRTYSRSQGQQGVTCSFAWNSSGAKEWRQKVAIFASMHACSSMDELKERFGRRWAYYYADIIRDIQIEGGAQ
jgi:hypothetical protein